MKKKQNQLQSACLRILLGFLACSILLFAIAHSQFSYLALLAVSAFFRQQSIQRVEHWLRQFKPLHTCVAISGIAVVVNLISGTPASAQWNGAQTAANTALTPYLGGDIVGLLFTIVFLLLFFLIVGGLMTWGYKAFRNEDAAVPMTAFIVGTVIYVGGEVFSKLFFGGGGANPAGCISLLQ